MFPWASPLTSLNLNSSALKSGGYNLSFKLVGQIPDPENYGDAHSGVSFGGL